MFNNKSYVMSIYVYSFVILCINCPCWFLYDNCPDYGHNCHNTWLTSCAAFQWFDMLGSLDFCYSSISSSVVGITFFTWFLSLAIKLHTIYTVFWSIFHCYLSWLYLLLELCCVISCCVPHVLFSVGT